VGETLSDDLQSVKHILENFFGYNLAAEKALDCGDPKAGRPGESARKKTAPWFSASLWANSQVNDDPQAMLLT